MAGHTSEKRWRDVNVNGVFYRGISEVASSELSALVNTLNSAEEAYQQMQEIYTYAGGTTTDLANLLFKEDIEGRSESVANADEIAKASDIVDAMAAAHQIFQAADNVVVTQVDRFSKMRRMI